MTAPETVQRTRPNARLDQTRLLFEIIKGTSNYLKGKLRYALPVYSVQEEFEPSADGGVLTLSISRLPEKVEE